MKNDKERKIVVAGLSVAGIALVFLTFCTDFVAGGSDNYAHFNISRWAFRYPYLFLDHWGKPVFTILTAPMAQLGFPGVRLFNIFCGLMTAFIAYRLVDSLNLKFSWFTVISVIFTPIYLVMMSSGMTEILFSLILLLSVYLFFRENYILSSAIISSIFLVRTEGLAFLLLFLAGFIIKKQYRAIPFLFSGFLIFSIIGGLYHYHDFLWLINYRPYATHSGFSVYGHGSWNHYFIKMPEYLGYLIPCLLFPGTVILIIRWIKSRYRLDGNAFLLMLFILGSFWGFFFIHSFLWWKGETSAGLSRVMAAVSPMAAVAGAFAVDYAVKRIRRQYFSTVLIVIFSGSLAIITSGYYRHAIEHDPNAKIRQRATRWLVNSGSLKHKLVMHDPYYAFSTGIDAWDNASVQFGFLNNDFPERGLPDSTIFIWDAHFSPNEGRLPLDKIIHSSHFEVVRVFKPDIPSKVLGGNDFMIVIFRKTGIFQENDMSILDKLINKDYEEGIYYRSRMNFEDPYPDPPMESRRIKDDQDSLNHIFNLEGTEFSPAFIIPDEEVANRNPAKIRISAKFNLQEPCLKGRLLMVFSAEKEGVSWNYVTSDIRDHVIQNNQWTTTTFFFNVPEKVRKGSIFKIYVWNIDKKNILVDELNLDMAQLK